MTTLVTGPLLSRNAGYDPLKDFIPVAMLASTPFALVVAPWMPAKTLEEFIAYARANPGKLNFGTPAGTLAHLTGELFRVRTGIDIVVIPYKGAATAVTDILGGQVDMTFEPTSVLVAHIQDAKVRPLAVTGAARSPQLPDVPTMIESGLAGFTSYSWTGILVPVGTSPEIVDRLNRSHQSGLEIASDEFRSRPAGRRNERGIAAGFCGVHRRRDTEMGSDHNVGGREARLSNHPGLWSMVSAMTRRLVIVVFAAAGVTVIAGAGGGAFAQTPPSERELRIYAGLHDAAARGDVAEIEQADRGGREAQHPGRQEPHAASCRSLHAQT